MESQGRSHKTDFTVALMACDLNSVPSHISKIGQLGARLEEGDLQARLNLLRSARDLVSALETPRETIIRHCWAEVDKTLPF